MNSADSLRFAVGDKPQYSTEIYLGDGTASAFQLSGYPLVTGATALGGQSPTVSIQSAGTWSSTSLSQTALLLGRAVFSTAIPYGTAVQFGYTFAAFSDLEIDNFTASYPGDLDKQKLAVIDTLLMDYAKRSRWNAQGVSVDDAVVFQNLVKMREVLWKQITQEQGPLGGMASWSVSQQYYG